MASDAGRFNRTALKPPQCQSLPIAAFALAVGAGSSRFLAKIPPPTLQIPREDSPAHANRNTAILDRAAARQNAPSASNALPVAW